MSQAIETLLTAIKSDNLYDFVANEAWTLRRSELEVVLKEMAYLMHSFRCGLDYESAKGELLQELTERLGGE